MYTIICDGFTIFEPTVPDLMIDNATCSLEVNAAGSAQFDIYPDNPYFGQIQYLKSVLEIRQDQYILFRGRRINGGDDYYNVQTVKMEGALAFTNDSIVRPFQFPEDFLEDTEYKSAAQSGNVVEFYLKKIIENHNSQVQEFQKLKLGIVTVKDPNNYITRSSEGYESTWENLKSKLFESSLGGYLYARYESDGTYIDYLEDFTLRNTQQIILSENMTDFLSETDASATYTAAIPVGKVASEDEEGNITTTNEVLTIDSYPDGDIDGQYVKSKDTIYDRELVERYGWIYAPVSETTWDDVTVVNNLVAKGKEYLAGARPSQTFTIQAVDLHYTDEQIQSFRAYRYVDVYSETHKIDQKYKLTKLSIDLLNPQNNVIEIGDKIFTLAEQSNNLSNRIEKIESDFQINKTKTEQALDNIENQLRVEIDSNYGTYQKTDKEGTVSPDYAAAPLTLTPATYFCGEKQTESVEYIWKRKITDEETDLAEEESAENGILTVSHNLTEQVRYICYATYIKSAGNIYVANNWLDFIPVEDGENGQDGIPGPKGDPGDAGPAGPQGEPGKDGADGKTSYFHIKYSSVQNPESPDQMTETPDTYIGTYADYVQADSSDPADYTWARFQGLQGPQGTQGIPGTNGADGKTSYLHIKYSNDGGKTFTANSGETVGDYIGTCVDYNAADPTEVSVYTWAKIKGEQGERGLQGLQGPKGDQGLQGQKGTDGKTSYTHIAYANSADGSSGFSTTDSADKTYIGQYTDYVQEDSTDPKKYAWTKIKGEQGPQGLQGIQGPKGETGIQGPKGDAGPAGPQGAPGKDGVDGKTSYFHIKYSEVPNPTSTTQMTETPSTYIGTYVDYVKADSSDPADYTWARFQGLQGPQGTQGIPGTNGADGKTSYLHIKYSNDGGKTFTANSGETVGDYIGTCVDYNAADPTKVSAYTWAKIKGNTGATGAPGKDGEDAAIASDTEPKDKTKLWLDTSVNPPLLKAWNGETWIIVNDMAIGVRNLLLDTDVDSLKAVSAPYDRRFSLEIDQTDKIGTFITVTDAPCATENGVQIQVVTEREYDAGCWIVFYDHTQEKPLGFTFDVGEQYTISCYARKTDGNPKFNLGIFEQTVYGYREITSEWKLYSLTFTATEKMNTTNNAWAIFGCTAKSSGVIQMTGFKLEKGGKATDWTPAQAELEEKIYQEVGSRISQESDRISLDVSETIAKVREEVSTSYDEVLSEAQTSLEDALQDYVDTGDYEAYKESVSAQLEILAEQISMNFTETTESITEVNGELQSQFDELSKYIRFSTAGIEIGEEGKALELGIDNDMIEFRKNGVAIGWWDGTDFHTGNIVVEVQERAQFGNFAFVPRTDGSLSFLKVGGN